jgi:hypothetical protein
MAVTTLLGLPIPSMSETVGKTIPDLASAMQIIDEKLGGVRIVDHNLDVASPPNGYYARWENGLQVCWDVITLTYMTASFVLGATWRFPAHFSDTSYAADGFFERFGTTSVAGQYSLNYVGPLTTEITFRLYAPSATFTEDTTLEARTFAIGRYK